MEYIKNNYKLLGAIVLLIVALFATYLQNRQEINEMKSSTELTMHVKDSLHVNDSIAIQTWKVKFDSLYKETRITSSVDVNTTVTKKGLSTVVVVTETTQPDGTVTKTTKTVTIDTTQIASVRIQTVIDSMNKEIEKRKDSVVTLTVAVHDTVNTKTTDIKYVHDTLYREVRNPEKKLELIATAGVKGSLSSTDNKVDPSVIPVIGVGASYDVAPPFFLTGGITSEGNPINYSDLSHYKANVAIGLKLKF